MKTEAAEGAESNPTSAGAHVDSLRGEGLMKAYRRRRVVDGVEVEVQPGEVVGLLGPNGAGKATTFCLLMGLTPADAGRVLLGERDITALPMHRRAPWRPGRLPSSAD